mgnify:CR=1 FL=1
MTRIPWLEMAILLPVIGSAVVALLSNRRPEWVKLAATLFSVATGGITVKVFPPEVDAPGSGLETAIVK